MLEFLDAEGLNTLTLGKYEKSVHTNTSANRNTTEGKLPAA